MNTESLVFVILAAIVAVFSVLSVTTKRIIRAATYLLFVLFGTAGLYFLMGYTFLGAVQVMVYAGGVVVLYIFAIMLTGKTKDAQQKPLCLCMCAAGLIAALIGAGLLMFTFISTEFASKALNPELTNEGAAGSVNQLGQLLLSAGDGGYLLPFEAVSVLLLACIIGGLIIARKR